ncbi:unnamed protein product [Linum trigynum]|uniref:Uncharacterized protein n=1 Tax=Linum trigynum TaxID=586398 RepID=A0AAV2GBR8_9ROSI
MTHRVFPGPVRCRRLSPTPSVGLHFSFFFLGEKMVSPSSSSSFPWSDELIPCRGIFPRSPGCAAQIPFSSCFSGFFFSVADVAVRTATNRRFLLRLATPIALASSPTWRCSPVRQPGSSSPPLPSSSTSLSS